MPGHGLYFYATREDLVPAIHAIEDRTAFRYALMGMHTMLTFPQFTSALEIPSLGEATGDQEATCDRYLVVPREAPIAVREVQLNSGGVRYAVDQLVNPNSIVFQPGGLRNDRVIISGGVTTTGQTEISKSIFRLFARWIKKGFEKRMAFYVGPAAMRLKTDGFRLTMGVQSPPLYDLA